MATAGRVYLDAAGPGPVSTVAREALLAALDEGWADPRRLHTEGRRARAVLDGAREAVAACLGARQDEVSFTAGHTTALHLGVTGLRHGRRRTGSRVVVSAVEHSAVLAAAEIHDQDPGSPAATTSEVVAVDVAGRVDVDAFAAAIARPGVAAACLQTANGEVGTVQPVEAVHARAVASGVPLMVDAGASIGHLAPPSTWDVLVADPRSWGTPPGIGVLAVRTGTRWRREGPADEHERGRVPGEVNVPLALAAAVALQDAERSRVARAARAHSLVHRLRRELAAGVPDCQVVGDPEDRLPHVVTFSCLFVDGEALVTELDRAGFAVGSGSACTASTLTPSHVLAAMGVLTQGNVRVGLPPDVTDDEVDAFAAAAVAAVTTVRERGGVAQL